MSDLSLSILDLLDVYNIRDEILKNLTPIDLCNFCEISKRSNDLFNNEYLWRSYFFNSKISYKIAVKDRFLTENTCNYRYSVGNRTFDCANSPVITFSNCIYCSDTLDKICHNCIKIKYTINSRCDFCNMVKGICQDCIID